jgi:hypothetical protein
MFKSSNSSSQSSLPVKAAASLECILMVVPHTCLSDVGAVMPNILDKLIYTPSFTIESTSLQPFVSAQKSVAPTWVNGGAPPPSTAFCGPVAGQPQRPAPTFEPPFFSTRCLKVDPTRALLHSNLPLLQNRTCHGSRTAPSDVSTAFAPASLLCRLPQLHRPRSTA